MNPDPKPAYSPGLEGVVAGESAICWVDPNAGLLYRGYDVHELAEQSTFEEVAWLLLRGELPAEEELVGFSRQLAQERAVPAEVLLALDSLPPGTHPMDRLRSGVSMLGAFDPDLNDHSHEANLRKAVRLIAKVPTLIAGDQPVAPGLTHAGHVLSKLTGKLPEPWVTKMFDAIGIAASYSRLRAFLATD